MFGAAPHAVAIRLAVALYIVRMNLRTPASESVRPVTRVDACPLAPVVEPDTFTVLIAVPQADAGAGAADGGMESSFAGAQRRGVPVSPDDERRERGCQLDEIKFLRRRRAWHAVIHGERAEERALIVEDRHRPAGAQAMRGRSSGIRRPKVRPLDVFDDDNVTAGRGRPARALPDGDWHRVDSLHIGGRQARRSSGPQQLAGRVDEQHAAVKTLGPGFDVGREPVEQRVQRRGRPEQRKQTDLRAELLPLGGRLWRTLHDRIGGSGPIRVRACARHAAPVVRWVGTLPGRSASYTLPVMARQGRTPGVDVLSNHVRARGAGARCGNPVR